MSLKSLALIENWPVPTASAGVVRGDGTVLGTHGPADHRFPLASVTKPLAAYAALVAYEEGAIELQKDESGRPTFNQAGLLQFRGPAPAGGVGVEVFSQARIDRASVLTLLRAA